EKETGVESPFPIFAAIRAVDLAVIAALYKNGPAGRLIQTVQQSQERAFSGAAWTDNGQNLSSADFKIGILHQNLVANSPAEVLGLEDDGVGDGRSDHRFLREDSEPEHATGKLQLCWRTLARSSATISCAALVAAACCVTSNEIAPTRACPPPP